MIGYDMTSPETSVGNGVPHKGSVTRTVSGRLKPGPCASNIQHSLDVGFNIQRIRMIRT